MSRLKIKDMPPVEVVDGTEIIPTGGKGDVSVTVERIKNYIQFKTPDYALNSELQVVDLRSQTNETNISSHIVNTSNPHQVTKAQVGLGNVDNTSDADKPISTATQSAITNLNNTKADVTYIDGLLASKANITYVDSGLATKLNTTSNATSASKLETPRSFSITGDASWTTSFDGTANVTAPLTLANSGVIANIYGTTTTIPVLSIDIKGRVTSASTATIPTSSTTTSGLVQLNDTTSSTSNTLAATANSVKVAYDLATVANTTANVAIPSSQKAVANGVATLDGNALIPVTQLPSATETTVGVSEIATQSEVNTATNDSFIVTPLKLLAGVKNHLNVSGNAPMYACRAWVNFNGSGTVAIRASGNVSSITDNGVGDYTVNFIIAMPDTNYAIAGAATLAAGSGSGSACILSLKNSASGVLANKRTTAAQIVTVDNNTDGLYDSNDASVSFYG